MGRNVGGENRATALAEHSPATLSAAEHPGSPTGHATADGAHPEGAAPGQQTSVDPGGVEHSTPPAAHDITELDHFARPDSGPDPFTTHLEGDALYQAADDILAYYGDRSAGMRTASDEILGHMLLHGDNWDASVALIEIVRRGSDSNLVPDGESTAGKIPGGKILRVTQVGAWLAMHHGPVNMAAGEGKSFVFLAYGARKAVETGSVNILTTRRNLADREIPIYTAMLKRFGYDVVRLNPNQPHPDPVAGRPTIYIGTLQDVAFATLREHWVPGRDFAVDEVDEPGLKDLLFCLKEGAATPADGQVRDAVLTAHTTLAGALHDNEKAATALVERAESEQHSQFAEAKVRAGARLDQVRAEINERLANARRYIDDRVADDTGNADEVRADGERLLGEVSEHADRMLAEVTETNRRELLDVYDRTEVDRLDAAARARQLMSEIPSDTPHLTAADFMLEPDRLGRTAFLTDSGRAKLTALLGYEPDDAQVKQFTMAAAARWEYVEGIHYEVHGGRVKIIDQISHEVMFDPETSSESRWFGGLAQALEAKHGLEILGDDEDNQKTITGKEVLTGDRVDSLTGGSGTASMHRAQIKANLGSDDPNKPRLSMDHITEIKRFKESGLVRRKDLVFDDENAKLDQMAADIVHKQQKGQAQVVLAHSNHIPAKLSFKLEIAKLRAGVDFEHVTVDAKWILDQGVDGPERLQQVFDEAGKQGKVLIINMQGARGVDYSADEVVRGLGGIHVLITGHSDISAGVDIQAENRTARAGEKGSVQYYVSPEDHLFTLSRNPFVKQVVVSYTQAVEANRANPNRETALVLAHARREMRAVVSELQREGVGRLQHSLTAAWAVRNPRANAPPATGQPTGTGNGSPREPVFNRGPANSAPPHYGSDSAEGSGQQQTAPGTAPPQPNGQQQAAAANAQAGAAAEIPDPAAAQHNSQPGKIAATAVATATQDWNPGSRDITANAAAKLAHLISGTGQQASTGGPHQAPLGQANAPGGQADSPNSQIPDVQVTRADGVQQLTMAWNGAPGQQASLVVRAADSEAPDSELHLTFEIDLDSPDGWTGESTDVLAHRVEALRTLVGDLTAEHQWASGASTLIIGAFTRMAATRKTRLKLELRRGTGGEHTLRAELFDDSKTPVVVEMSGVTKPPGTSEPPAVDSTQPLRPRPSIFGKPAQLPIPPGASGGPTAAVFAGPGISNGSTTAGSRDSGREPPGARPDVSAVPRGVMFQHPPTRPGPGAPGRGNSSPGNRGRGGSGPRKTPPTRGRGSGGDGSVSEPAVPASSGGTKTAQRQQGSSIQTRPLAPARRGGPPAAMPGPWRRAETVEHPKPRAKAHETPWKPQPARLPAALNRQHTPWTIPPTTATPPSSKLVPAPGTAGGSSPAGDEQRPPDAPAPGIDPATSSPGPVNQCDAILLELVRAETGNTMLGVLEHVGPEGVSGAQHEAAWAASLQDLGDHNQVADLLIAMAGQMSPKSADGIFAVVVDQVMYRGTNKPMVDEHGVGYHAYRLVYRCDADGGNGRVVVEDPGRGVVADFVRETAGQRRSYGVSLASVFNRFGTWMPWQGTHGERVPEGLTANIGSSDDPAPADSARPGGSGTAEAEHEDQLPESLRAEFQDSMLRFVLGTSTEDDIANMPWLAAKHFEAEPASGLLSRPTRCVAEALIALIRTERLPPGSPLPSIPALSTFLGVGLHVVERAIVKVGSYVSRGGRNKRTLVAGREAWPVESRLDPERIDAAPLVAAITGGDSPAAWVRAATRKGFTRTLSEALTASIRSGAIPEHSTLPTTADIADALGVPRHLVLIALRGSQPYVVTGRGGAARVADREQWQDDSSRDHGGGAAAGLSVWSDVVRQRWVENPDSLREIAETFLFGRQRQVVLLLLDGISMSGLAMQLEVGLDKLPGILLQTDVRLSDLLGALDEAARGEAWGAVGRDELDFAVRMHWSGDIRRLEWLPEQLQKCALQERDTVLSVVNRLPPDERECVRLRLAGVRSADIARILDISPSQVAN